MPCICCEKFPNTVLVIIIDEDGAIDEFEDAYFSDFQDSDRTIFSQYTNYSRSLFETANLEGFVGIILVPVLSPSYPSDHDRMVQRMNEFKNSIPEPYFNKVIITPEVSRNTDYSQILIDAIESLRFIDDSENPIQIDYIVTQIDNSGSHRNRDFDSTFLNYYAQYSDDLAIQTLSDLGISTNYIGALSDVNAYRSTGLIYGVGTKHIITTHSDSSVWSFQAENWLAPIHNFLLLIAGYINNPDRNKNCDLICKHRWTTFEGNLLLPIFPYELSYDSAGLINSIGSVLPYILDDDNCVPGSFQSSCRSAYNELKGLDSDYDIFSFIENEEGYLLKAFFWPNPESYEISSAGQIYWVRIKDLQPNGYFSNSPYIDSNMIILEPFLEALISLRNIDTSSYFSCPCNYFYPLNQYYKLAPRT